jgi:hypothetical protein
VQQAANDEEADADDKDDEDNADQEQSQGQAENGALPAQDGSQPNAGPKTPEQILDMIRQRQQVPPGQVPPRITPPNQPPDNQ